MRIEINKFIVADSEICHGKPTFKGTRVMVHSILEMLEAGETPAAILAGFEKDNAAYRAARLKYLLY